MLVGRVNIDTSKFNMRPVLHYSQQLGDIAHTASKYGEQAFSVAAPRL